MVLAMGAVLPVAVVVRIDVLLFAKVVVGSPVVEVVIRRAVAVAMVDVKQRAKRPVVALVTDG